jgi:hypothetical protein
MKFLTLEIERVFPHPNPPPKGEGMDSLLPLGEGLGMRDRRT